VLSVVGGFRIISFLHAVNYSFIPLCLFIIFAETSQPMLPIVQKVAKEYKESLQRLYGDELVELILFGSYARDNFNEESDVDFAIVLRSPKTRAAAEIPKISVVGSRLSLKYGIMLSSLPTSWDKKQTSMQGIYQEIRKEGIVI
jgi:predicted nucleotidyltransferase